MLHVEKNFTAGNYFNYKNNTNINRLIPSKLTNHAISMALKCSKKVSQSEYYALRHNNCSLHHNKDIHNLGSE